MRSRAPPPRRHSRSRVPPEVRDYWLFRPALQALNDRMIAEIPPEALEEIGTALGVLRDGRYVFPDETAMGMFGDCCLHDWVDEQGSSLVARSAELMAGDLTETELEVLDALVHARFAQFRVEELLPGVGARILSPIDDAEFTLVEPLLARLPDAQGVWWVARLMFPRGCCMTTGSPLPLGRPLIDDPDLEFALLRGGLLRSTSEQELALALARCAIEVIGGQSEPEDEVEF